MINGLNVERIAETVNVIQENKSLRDVNIKATSVWKEGGLSENYVGRGEDSKAVKVCADMLPLQGTPSLATSCGAACPTELMLIALSSCLVIGMSCNASLRGIAINSLEITTEGHLDIGGFLGMEAKRNGYKSLKFVCNIDADASQKELAELFDYVQKTSPVLDTIINGLDNVSIELNTSPGA